MAALAGVVRRAWNSRHCESRTREGRCGPRLVPAPGVVRHRNSGLRATLASATAAEELAPHRRPFPTRIAADGRVRTPPSACSLKRRSNACSWLHHAADRRSWRPLRPGDSVRSRAVACTPVRLASTPTTPRPVPAIRPGVRCAALVHPGNQGRQHAEFTSPQRGGLAKKPGRGWLIAAAAWLNNDRGARSSG
jgi:hypothetical protein